MKKRSFLAGMLTTALIGGLGFSALAATGSFTITVDPVNIQVNGATFAPKDATGNDVPVFAYGGTTYAPLRALAEAYGLTVGYDEEQKMATVAAAPATPETPKTTYLDWSKEDEAAYQEFKGYWDVGLGVEDEKMKDVSYHIVATLKLPKEPASIAALWNGMNSDCRERFSTRLIEEYYVTLNPLPVGYFGWLNKPETSWIAGVRPPSVDRYTGSTVFNVQHHDFD